MASRCPSTHARPVGRVGDKLGCHDRNIQFPWETLGGGNFWISKNWFGPCSKNLAENRFETKLLIYIMFFDGKGNVVQPRPSGARTITGSGIPRYLTLYSAPENADP